MYCTQMKKEEAPLTVTEQLSQFGLCTFQLGLPDPRANFKIQIHKLHKYKSAIQYKYKNRNTLFNAKLVTNTPVFGVFRGTKNMTMERNGNYGRRGCDTH